VKLDYWIDEQMTKSIQYYGNYYNSGPMQKLGNAFSSSLGLSVSTSVKIERKTFLPPNSSYSRSQFYILPINFFNLDTKNQTKEVLRNDKPKKKTKIYEKSYSNENSPLIFRNFLTISFSENFDNEFYVDNEFYIRDIKEMKRRHFEYMKRDESFKYEKFYLHSDYMNERSFYLYFNKFY
jgi:hypothetical protein